MTAKWVSACELGSTHFKERHQQEMNLVQSKVIELKDVLLEVVVCRTMDFDQASSLLAELPKGLGMDAVSKCGNLLSQLVSLEPLQKVPLAKVLGKLFAQEVESSLANSWKVFRAVTTAFPALVKLAQVEANEGQEHFVGDCGFRGFVQDVGARDPQSPK